LTTSSGPPAVIWDCDGTVVDSEPIGIAVWTDLLTEYGCQPNEADWELLVGKPYPAFYSHFAERCELPPAQDLLDVYLQLLYPALRSGLRPFEDAVAAIDLLSGRGIPMALATSSYRERLDVMLDTVGLASRFDVTVAGDEVDAGKPEPDIYEAAAAKLGVPESSCVAIEDTVSGVAAAVAAGMRVVGVARGARSAKQLAAADLVVECLDGHQLWVFMRKGRN
jgi:HAD superfamily hydrolase (TIGR01509 family)